MYFVICYGINVIPQNIFLEENKAEHSGNNEIQDI